MTKIWRLASKLQVSAAALPLAQIEVNYIKHTTNSATITHQCPHLFSNASLIKTVVCSRSNFSFKRTPLLG